MQSYKHAFSRALAADPTRLHVAAHSHHPWPDLARDAHLEAWDDAARLLDHKWERVFGEVLPAARAHIARILGLPDPGTLCFAPNVHEFLVRIESALRSDRPLRILSSGSEFHSFTRQVARWVEVGRAQWTTVPTEPFATFPDRFAEAARAEAYDLVYVSQVFYDSGWVFEEAGEILTGLTEPTTCVVDGYHGFMATKTDLQRMAARVFYTSGGYKYAMSGEGACFLHCPPGHLMAPVDTGWFAGFDALARADGSVEYATDGGRFFGATFDPSGLYRFVAVADWLEREGLDVSAIHERVVVLQDRLIAAVERGSAGPLTLDDLLSVRGTDPRRGNFLCFRRADAGALCEGLRRAGVVVDSRADRLRFGFGLYHDLEDVDRLVEALRTL
jgi:kynureninase